MGTAQGGGLNGAAPFLTKTYEMVDDPLTDSMVSWSHSGCSFVVWKPPEFTQYLLPSYFKHGNFSSFVRQLNTYGFKKIHPYQWEFANVDFIRGQKSLLMNIHRRKPIHSHSTQNQEKISPLTETERQELEDEIKLLKHENAVLELKLESYGRDKQGFEFQTQALTERLQSMERRQMQLMPFLAQQIKKPGFASILAQRLQHDNKRRRISESDSFHGLRKEKEDQTSPDRFPVPLANFELIEKLDSSLKFWENVFYEVGDNFGQEVSSGGIMSRPSPVNVGNLSALSGDGEPSSPVTHPSSNNSGDIHSSSEPVGYVNDADHAMPAGANDQFWQSFLTEAPGSSVMSEPEHQSEKKTTAVEERVKRCRTAAGDFGGTQTT